MARLDHTAGQKQDGMRPPCVLVAEDDDDIRKIVATVLRDDGYDVIEVASGTDLLDRLERVLSGRPDTVRPDLVVSDIRMPGFSGLDALAQIRGARWSPEFILMTAYGNEAIYEEAGKLGADVLDKPFDTDDLRIVVRNTLPADVWSRAAEWSTYAERNYGLGDDLMPG